MHCQFLLWYNWSLYHYRVLLLKGIQILFWGFLSWYSRVQSQFVAWRIHTVVIHFFLFSFLLFFCLFCCLCCYWLLQLVFLCFLNALWGSFIDATMQSSMQTSPLPPFSLTTPVSLCRLSSVRPGASSSISLFFGPFICVPPFFIFRMIRCTLQEGMPRCSLFYSFYKF